MVGLIVLSPMATSPAAAHETEQPYLYLFLDEDSGLDGRLELAIGDVAQVLNLELPEDDIDIEQVLRDNTEALHGYAEDHLSISTGESELPIEFGQVDLFREAPGELAFAVVQYQVTESPATPPTELQIQFDPFFDEVSGRDGLLLLSGAYENGQFLRDKELLVTFNSDNRDQVIDLGAEGAWGNFRASVTLGIDHIKTGPDHILFVLALLLPSVLIFSGHQWQAIDGFGSSLWRILKIATFFTLAHSITFTLAGMGWLPTPPSKIVEAIIAGSIAAAALHNIHPLLPNREWSISFLFGLFHGMGFASLVSNLDVSRSSQLISLLGRNVGIEIGQAVVILILFPSLFLLRRTPLYRPFLYVGSMALAALACLWMVERIFEVTLGTDDLVANVTDGNRGWVFAAVLAAAAVAAFALYRNRDELLPVHIPD